MTRRVAKEAEEGGAAVQKSIAGLTRVGAAMKESAGVVKDMGKKAGEIGGIVSTINLIAERDEPAVSECFDRGGAGRRCRPGLCRRRGGNSQPG